MLRPNKHMNPDRSVLWLSTVLLSHLRAKRAESYSGLLKVAQGAFAGADAIFVPAISLLYLLGTVDYRRKSDSFEYGGP